MKYTNLILIMASVIALTIFSCSKDKLDLGESIGIWVEEEPADVIAFEGSNHIFEFFEGNTFHLELRQWTDVIVLPCSGNTTEYIKGTYTLTDEQLSIVGKYTDASYDDEQANCTDESDYAETYQFTYDGDDWILHSDAELEYHQVRLIKQ